MEKRIVRTTELANGVMIDELHPDDIPETELVNVTDAQVEKMARGFILGTKSVGRRRDIRAKLEERVTKRIGKKGKLLVDKLFELIEGVYLVHGEGKDSLRYYKTPPNLQAIIYALDRVLGKPRQHTEHTEEKRGLILVEHVIRNMAAKPQEATHNANGTGENFIGDGRGRAAGGEGTVDLGGRDHEPARAGALQG